MSKSKSFTVIELIIVIVLIFSVMAVVFGVVDNSKTQRQNMGCEYYDSYLLENVPAKCLNYFINKPL